MGDAPELEHRCESCGRSFTNKTGLYGHRRRAHPDTIQHYFWRNVGGYAKDGGLYMPHRIPKVTEEEFVQWQKLSYEFLVFEILRKFIGEEEIPDDALRHICNTSFQKFSHSKPIGMKSLENDIIVFELFNGPTLAFKDLALFIVAGLLDYFLQKRNKHSIALVGTSGDTGSSALESVKVKENLNLIVLLPKDRCSLIQKLQMTTVCSKNTHVYCVEGTSDDLDVPIKQCFEDDIFVSKHNLISLNSINMGRILAQIPIYVYAYYQLASKLGEEIEIVVPTGAAGSITAGSMANLMGFPIRLVSCVNKNDVVAKTFLTGIFSRNDEVLKTYANAMDIQMPYNVERLFYLYSDGEAQIVSKMMEDFETKGKAEVPDTIMIPIRQVIPACNVVSDQQILKTIKYVKEKYDYIICPHTATAADYCLFSRKSEKKIPRGIFATASPEKFPDAIADAGFEISDSRLKYLLGQKENFTEMKKGENWLQILRDKISTISDSKLK